MSDYRLSRYTPQEKHDLYSKVVNFWESVINAYPHRKNEYNDKLQSAKRMLKRIESD